MSKHGEDDNSIETLEGEIVSGERPEKALAELSTPLYEKVVCNIPFLVMDKSRKLVNRDSLNRIRYKNKKKSCSYLFKIPDSSSSVLFAKKLRVGII